VKGRAVLALLLLALAVRLAFVAATPGYVPHHDDRDYDRLACWISDRVLPPDRSPPFPSASSCAERGRPGELTAYRPPLWPIALGGSDAVAEVVDAPRWTAGRVLQAVIGTVVVGLIGTIAARLWEPTVGLIAMGLGAVFLPLVLDGASLISEPLFVALELGAVLAFLHYRAPPHRIGWAIASGALVGLAALTRTSGALLALALLAAFGARPRGRGWVAAGCFAATAALVVVPWTIRNEVVMRAFVPVSTETGGTLLGTYNPAAWHDPGCPGCWILLSRTPAEMGLAHRLLALPEVARDSASRALAERFALRHPGYVLQVAWDNSLRLLDLGGERRIRSTARSIDVPPGAAIAGAWELWLVIGLAAAGGLRRAPPALLALVAFLWLTTALVVSDTPRFRATIDPFLLMLAAVGLCAVLGHATLRPWTTWRRSSSPPSASPRRTRWR
jgi:hypothetical protein